MTSPMISPSVPYNRHDVGQDASKRLGICAAMLKHFGATNTILSTDLALAPLCSVLINCSPAPCTLLASATIHALTHALPVPSWLFLPRSYPNDAAPLTLCSGSPARSGLLALATVLAHTHSLRSAGLSLLIGSLSLDRLLDLKKSCHPKPRRPVSLCDGWHCRGPFQAAPSIAAPKPPPSAIQDAPGCTSHIGKAVSDRCFFLPAASVQ
ncbi:hypothetical protein DFH06DRAFT_211683 [Mycena polygramma]|nr:hypothetical protein DFH06DRAFT_211683 [Mycena polygramma]